MEITGLNQRIAGLIEDCSIALVIGALAEEVEDAQEEEWRGYIERGKGDPELAAKLGRVSEFLRNAESEAD